MLSGSWKFIAVVIALMALSGRPVLAEPSQAPRELQGRWLAEDIGGAGVIDRLQTILEIREDGAIGGSGGCNRMRGTAKIEGRKINFGPIASTRMACVPAAMVQERKFFAAMEKVRSWRIDKRRQKLVLLDRRGKRLVVFTRA